MANCARYEPTIDEIMADPTVRALMQADRVNPDRLRKRLINLAHRSADPLPASMRAPVRLAAARGSDAAERHVWG